MLKNQRVIKSVFIFGLILISLFVTVIPNTSKAKIYNARFVVDISWNGEEAYKPIIPRDEIKKVDLNITLRVDTGESFGKGIMDSYENKFNGVIDLEIIEFSPWCSAVLESLRVITPGERKASTITPIYINIDEDAPAYGEGFIKIRASARKVQLIEGSEPVEFILNFLPSFKPLIKINLPEENTKRVDPMSSAEFPIEIENIGNSRTKIFFSVENVPEGWKATVTDEIVLDEEKGSKSTAYLTIIPPKDSGYHYEEANIKIKMIPARAENLNDTGEPLYASFTVQNRGLSVYGTEQILFFGILALIILVIVVFILRWLLRRRKKTTS